MRSPSLRRTTGLAVVALALAACRGGAPPPAGPPPVDAAAPPPEAPAVPPGAPSADAPAAPAPATPPAAPATASPEKPRKGSSAADAAAAQKLSRIEREYSVAQQEKSHLAQRLFETALALKREFKFAEAMETARRAVDLDPDHAEARALYLEMGALLDQHPERTKTVSEFVKDQLAVRTGQVEAEVENHIEKGRRYLADQKFTQAVREFEQAEEKLVAIPYEGLPLKQRMPEVQGLLRQTRDEQAEFQRVVEAENRAAAQREAEKEEARRKHDVVETVRTLLKKAVEAFEQKHYDRCAELCEQILQIDPKYRAAVDLRDHAFKARHKQEYADYLTHRIVEWKKVMDEESETMIPYSQSIRFPDAYTWGIISRRLRSLSVREQEEEQDPQIVAIRNKLDNLKIDLDFQDAALADIIDFIREFAGFNIDIDSAVRSDPAVMDKKISFKVKDLVLGNVLKLLLSQYGLDYTFREGLLYITKPESAQGNSILTLHDVRDLLVKVSDNPGPTIELRPPSQQGGLAGAAFTLDEPRGAAISEEQIENLVKENVAPDTWDTGDHAISLTPNQQLLVNHTPQVHGEVREFLGKLRQYAGSMVSIESRFVAAHDNFLEDIGLDIRGLQDVLDAGTGRSATIAPATGPLNSVGASALTPPTVVDFNDRSGDNEPGFITNENARAENFDLRFRTMNTFRADNGAGTLVNEGGIPGYILGNRLANRGGLGLEYSFLGEQELELVLRAVRKTEKAIIVSAPKVTVFNTQRSNAFIATQRAYIQDFDIEVTTLSFALDPIIGYVQDGIVLDVRPIISNDRRYITMELRTTFAEFQGFRIVLIDPPINAVLQLPFLVVEKAETTVRIPDRGTLLISGFKDILSRDLYSTVPFLGDLPLINFFFSRKGKGIEKRKLYILLTGEIIDLGEHQAKQKEPPQ